MLRVLRVLGLNSLALQERASASPILSIAESRSGPGFARTLDHTFVSQVVENKTPDHTSQTTHTFFEVGSQKKAEACQGFLPTRGMPHQFLPYSIKRSVGSMGSMVQIFVFNGLAAQTSAHTS